MNGWKKKNNYIKPEATNDHMLRLIAFNRIQIEKEISDIGKCSLVERRKKAIKELEEELIKRGVVEIDAEIKKMFPRHKF